jgi:hypothetical protein
MRSNRFAISSCALFMIPFCVLLQSVSAYAQHVFKINSPEVKALVEEYRTAIQTEMENTDTPGLSIAIIWDRKPIWVESFGSTDITGKKKVTNKTMFVDFYITCNHHHLLGMCDRLWDLRSRNRCDRATQTLPEASSRAKCSNDRS